MTYEMSQEDLDALLAACRPVAMIALQCGTPRSQQERANDAWRALGEKMGFDFMTVRPIRGRSDRFFTAEPRRPTAPAATAKKTPATILEEAVSRDDVRMAVATWLGLPALDGGAVYCIGEVVKTALDQDRVPAATDYARSIAAGAVHPVALAACAFALLMAGQVPHVPTADQARAFRHLAHQTAAADRDETSPVRLRPTQGELRHRDAVRRWRK